MTTTRTGFEPGSFHVVAFINLCFHLGDREQVTHNCLAASPQRMAMRGTETCSPAAAVSCHSSVRHGLRQLEQPHSTLHHQPMQSLYKCYLQRGQADERPAEQQVEEMSQNMRRLMHAKPGPVTQFLLDSAVELGCKVPTYALLIGEIPVMCAQNTHTAFSLPSNRPTGFRGGAGLQSAHLSASVGTSYLYHKMLHRLANTMYELFLPLVPQAVGNLHYIFCIPDPTNLVIVPQGC